MPDRTDEPSTRAEKSAHLVVTLATGPAHVHRRTLVGPGPWTIGRDPACALHLAEPTLSRHHAELRLQAGTLEVRDLGSRHGTRLDDAELEEERWTLLPEGQPLRLGALSLEVRQVPGLPAAAAELLQGSANEDADRDAGARTTSELAAVQEVESLLGADMRTLGPEAGRGVDEDGHVRRERDARGAEASAAADSGEGDQGLRSTSEAAPNEGTGVDPAHGRQRAPDAMQGGLSANANDAEASRAEAAGAEASRVAATGVEASRAETKGAASEARDPEAPATGSGDADTGAPQASQDAHPPSPRRPLLRTWGPLLLAAFALAGVLGLLLLARALFVMPAAPLP